MMFRPRSVRAGLGEKVEPETKPNPRYAHALAKAHANVKVEACITLLKQSAFPSGSELRRLIDAMRALKS